jgi:hypothetical protein
MLESGEGVATSHPEIAEPLLDQAAASGSAYAQIEFADRLRQGSATSKRADSNSEVVALLTSAMGQGSAQATVQLAQIYRTGELGTNKKPIEAMRLAYRAIDLEIATDPTDPLANPYNEMAAGHLLVEMGKNGEAVDPKGRPLLTSAEIGRLEHYYGSVDPETRRVKVRQISVPIYCALALDSASHVLTPSRPIWRTVAVWDWGRVEAPTEIQIRYIERQTGCPHNANLRATLINAYQQARKNKIAFADLLYQRIQNSKSADSRSHQGGQH